MWLSRHILYNNIVSLYLGVVKFEFSQQPEVVKVGGEVKVVCKATAAEGQKIHCFSWTDGDGMDIQGTLSTNPERECVLTVNESKLDESKVVYCTVSIEVDKKQKQENGSYTVHVAGESYCCCYIYCCIYNMELSSKYNVPVLCAYYVATNLRNLGKLQ